ncbi:HNH endonuclease signature motif containing protein [Klenkia soli]|uniref:HNH endonuclease signature motif containing protein n=1 Tax=Klenkia soli TaxID=1052260 RepID=UPI001041FA98|nr:HNH endonuclease signature motif containing protein [Klenkia soli]
MRKLKADGDTRPSGEIETELVVTLLTRPWEQLDPAIAHLTVNADLADLLVPDLSALIAQAQAEAEAEAEAEARAGGADVGGESAATADVDGNTDGGSADFDSGADSAEDDTEVEVEVEADAEADADAGDTVAGEASEVEVGAAHSARTGPPDDGTGVPDAGVGPLAGEQVAFGGAQVGHVDGLSVTPAAVRSLLTWIDALGLTHPDGGGELAFTITGQGGRLLAVATPEELVIAAKAGRGVGPPPVASRYTPTAAQYRYLRARDRHCRFPGCRQVARACDADHVIPYDHHNPTAGGPTCVRNLAMLCRRHHRLKTHSPGWRFQMGADGTLHVTTPGGTTRTTRPPAMGEVLDLDAEPAPPDDPTDDPPPF